MAVRRTATLNLRTYPLLRKKLEHVAQIEDMPLGELVESLLAWSVDQMAMNPDDLDDGKVFFMNIVDEARRCAFEYSFANNNIPIPYGMEYSDEAEGIAEGENK